MKKHPWVNKEETRAFVCSMVGRWVTEKEKVSSVILKVSSVALKVSSVAYKVSSVVLKVSSVALKVSSVALKSREGWTYVFPS